MGELMDAWIEAERVEEESRAAHDWIHWRMARIAQSACLRAQLRGRRN